MTQSPVPTRYVGFCDVLGFSSAILNDFDATIALYREFQGNVRRWPFPKTAQVSVYSDSILVVSDDLPAVIHTIVSLNWAALRLGWLIRGGVAYGKYWEEKADGNLFVVSDALVKAVALEKTVKVPAVAVSNEITLGIEAWIPRFQHGIFKAPLLHFLELSVVNPFNPYWFASAVARVKHLLDAHPQHREKYEWFLSLPQAVADDDILVPEAALAQMLDLGVLKKRPDPPTVFLPEE